ncbi:MAG: IPT/TIG domain-containing protein, partial [Thermomonas sp.]
MRQRDAHAEEQREMARVQLRAGGQTAARLAAEQARARDAERLLAEARAALARMEQARTEEPHPVPPVAAAAAASSAAAAESSELAALRASVTEHEATLAQLQAEAVGVAVAVAGAGRGRGTALPGAAFTFEPAPELLALEPPLGPSRGNVTVRVLGRHMPDHDGAAACRFGRHAVVPARWVSRAEVVCVAPPLPPGAFGMVQTARHPTGPVT